jgi:hypothetical protein
MENINSNQKDDEGYSAQDDEDYLNASPVRGRELVPYRDPPLQDNLPANPLLPKMLYPEWR